jgi:glutaminyl-peptide cyclotransferase
MRKIALALSFVLFFLLVACAPSAPSAVPTIRPTLVMATPTNVPAAAPSPPPTRVPPTATTAGAPTGTRPSANAFDGDHAYNVYLIPQMNIGPRPAGTAADRATGDFIIAELRNSKWEAVTQEFDYRGVQVRNVIGKAGQGRGPVIVIGAHYDTRKLADQDKAHPDQPVPGANDGASGVAVLLELARTLDVSKLKNEVWLAFFDAEDNGDIAGCVVAPPPCSDNSPWPWSVGATYVAEHISPKPGAVIIVDMIGDKDQNIYYEQNSDKPLQEQLWGIAARLGYSEQFISQERWSMEDDHTPFLQHGIRAVDIIDFDYPYWHTIQDTTDKVSGASLGRVGRVLQVWLEGG